MYQLTVTSEPPACTYTFNQQFTLIEATNPFPPTSGVVPQFINAVLVDADQMVAFAGDNVHRYDRATQTWTDHGLATCFS